MVKIEKFYADLLDMLKLKVSTDGTIMIHSHGVDTPLLVDGLPMVIPNSNNIKTVIELKDGKPTPVKYIFNPLNESAIRGENKSFNKLKSIIELKLLGTIFGIGETIFSLLSDKDSEINDIIISKFLTKLNKYKTSAVKQMIDGKTISVWADLYNNIIQKFDKEKYLSLYIKKGGLIDNVKYNRIGVITYPFIEALDKFSIKDGKFLDVSLRNKDRNAIISLFEFMFGEKDIILSGRQYGSLNKIAPSTHVLLMMYDDIYNSLKDILDAIKNMDIDADIKDMLELNPLPFNIATLSDIIEDLQTDIKQIPSMEDTSALKTAANSMTSVTNVNPMEALANKNSAKSIPVQEQPKQNYSSPWEKLEAKQHQTSQKPMMQQPIVQQPMAVPVMQQPMMQQPTQPYGGPIVREVNPYNMQQPYNQQPIMHANQMPMGQTNAPMYGGYNNRPIDPWA